MIERIRKMRSLLKLGTDSPKDSVNNSQKDKAEDPKKEIETDKNIKKTMPIPTSEIGIEKNIMTCKIVSYYADFTPNPYYKNFAQTLKERCEKFEVDYDISELESRGTYGANCLMKPEFILNKLKENKKPILWMDCDTDFRNPFSHFNNIFQDIGMATHSGDMSGIKASPVYFNYTSGAFRIIREWIVHCRAAFVRNLPELDHDALKHYVLRVLNGKYTAYLLSDNHNDFVHGKYINNGNSRIQGKSEIHSKMGLVKDSDRDLYTAGIPLFKIYFEDPSYHAIESAYKFLEKFSNYNRIEIILPQETPINSEYFNQLTVESGNSIKFKTLNFDDIKIQENQIFLSVKAVKDIEKNWDEKIWSSISRGLNPLHALNFIDDGLGSIKIKTNRLSWI